jgi:hypothetical protein
MNGTLLTATAGLALAALGTSPALAASLFEAVAANP